jgi:glycosyltransferase involved in cell wall biosynthesis
MNTRSSSPIRVLMLGPGDGVGGGIAALLRVVLPLLREQVDLEYLATVKNRALKYSGRVSRGNLLAAGSQYLRFLVRILRSRPEIVHVHTSHGVAWLKDTFFVLTGKGLGSRVVLHMHGGNFFEHFDRGPQILRWYSRVILRLADRVICLFPDGERRVAGIVRGGRVKTLVNCVDLDEITPASTSARLQPLCALFLGRVGPSKGTSDLIEALAVLRDRSCFLRTRIAGGEERAGDLATALERVNALGLADRCELPGEIDAGMRNRFLAESSVFVLPSYFECMPMAVLEAMAAGLPIIATRVGGIPMLVENGVNGFLVEPGDVNALAGCIQTVMENPGLRDSMGCRSRETAQRLLDARQYVADLKKIYLALAPER